jgi:lipid A 3-O-deacylase
MIRKIGVMAGAGAVFFLCGNAYADNALAVELGRGDDRTNALRVSFIHTWRKGEPASREWHLVGYWEFSGAVWDNRDESVADVSVTPVFRLARSSVYVEGAIGFHLVSTHISAHRTFSTVYQFGEHLGAGYRFGPARRYDLGLRVQHISNGGLSQPNPGINFVLMRFQYDLE